MEKTNNDEIEKMIAVAIYMINQQDEIEKMIAIAISVLNDETITNVDESFERGFENKANSNYKYEQYREEDEQNKDDNIIIKPSLTEYENDKNKPIKTEERDEQNKDDNIIIKTSLTEYQNDKNKPIKTVYAYNQEGDSIDIKHL